MWWSYGFQNATLTVWWVNSGCYSCGILVLTAWCYPSRWDYCGVQGEELAIKGERSWADFWGCWTWGHWHRHDWFVGTCYNCIYLWVLTGTLEYSWVCQTCEYLLCHGYLTHECKVLVHMYPYRSGYDVWYVKYSWVRVQVTHKCTRVQPYPVMSTKGRAPQISDVFFIHWNKYTTKPALGHTSGHPDLRVFPAIIHWTNNTLHCMHCCM
jgi:hypothetical protein